MRVFNEEATAEETSPKGKLSRKGRGNLCLRLLTQIRDDEAGNELKLIFQSLSHVSAIIDQADVCFAETQEQDFVAQD